MNVIKHTGRDQILTQVSVKDKWELIDRLLDTLLRHPVCLRQTAEVRGNIRSTMLEREKQMSTGLGKGYAYPHARVPGFREFAVALAIVPDGVEYDSPDGIPVRIACMIVTSREDPTVGLRVMSAITRLLSDESASAFFLKETRPQAIYDYLRKAGLEIDVAVKARDIMRAPLASVAFDDPLPEMTRMMLRLRLESVSVTDAEGTVLGQITCDMLFNRGIPEFFGQLHSVSFIKDFDPFEKYFEEETHAVAGDLMSDDFGCVDEDTTLIEMIHELSVHHRPKLYVVREGKLVGIVDRLAVLERVLNL